MSFKSILLFLTITLVSQASFTQIINWTGSTSTDWHTASNWDQNQIPAAGADVRIPTGITNNPTVSAAALARIVTVHGTAHLTVADGGTLTIVGGTYGLNLNNAGTTGKITIESGGVVDIDDINQDGIRLAGGTLINAGTININDSGSWGINCQPDYSVDPSVLSSIHNQGNIFITNSGDIGIRMGNSPILNDSCALISSDRALLGNNEFENYGTIHIKDNTTITPSSIRYNYKNGIVHHFGSNPIEITNNFGIYNTDTSKIYWTGCLNNEFHNDENWSLTKAPEKKDNVILRNIAPENEFTTVIVSSALDTFGSINIDTSAVLRILSGGSMAINRVPPFLSTIIDGEIEVSNGGEMTFYNSPTTIRGAGSILNYGEVSFYSSPLTVNAQASFSIQPCGIGNFDPTSTINGTPSPNLISNIGLLNYEPSFATGDLLSIGLMYDNSDQFTHSNTSTKIYDKMSKDFYYGDHNGNGTTLCEGDLTDLSNQDCSGAFNLACGETVTGYATWQDPAQELLGDCVAFADFFYSGSTWYKFTGTGNIHKFSGSITPQGTQELQIYKGSCHTPICVAGSYIFSGMGGDSIAFPTIAGEDYFLMIATYNADVSITDYSLTMSCGGCDESRLYIEPDHALTGTTTISSDNQISAKNTITSGTDVTYSAKHAIELNSLFEVESNALFEVYNTGCP